MTTTDTPVKPLGIKAYGSIGHLPDSRLGPGDHSLNAGQASLLTTKARDKHDIVTVTEKLDGSCCAVANVGGQIVPLTRSGHVATTSKYEQHHVFALWVRERAADLSRVLFPGTRMIGEWMAQAHGTRYKITDPQLAWRPFDAMNGHNRVPWAEVETLAKEIGLRTPHVLHEGGPLAVRDAVALLGQYGWAGALDPVEGIVWRMEREGHFDFMGKLVFQTAEPGRYLPEVNERLTGVASEPVWNWRPGPTR